MITTAGPIDRRLHRQQLSSWVAIVLMAASLGCGMARAEQSPAVQPARWWSDAVEHALDQSGSNRIELVQALKRTPPGEREGIEFLVQNMPQRDLESVSAKFLLDHLNLAYAAFAAAPWHERVPGDIFLNDILPYASVDETRDAWRGVLHEKCAPLVAGCKTPADAAQRLNEKLFQLLNVRYSTNRWKANQSPLETIQSGMATCTGLSILLVDACRSVGVPARLVGTPMWANLRGNHTWVEIWDGKWHFAGAAEPDPQGLDHGWFEQNASQALENVPSHAIYASSFKKTGLSFPLVWSPKVDWVSAVNVTARYTTKSDSGAAASPVGEWKFPCPPDEIAHYTAYHVSEAIRVDGRLDEKVWQEAPQSPRFVDIISGKPAIHDTRAMVLWDDENLYVGFRVQEPFVHARFTTNNSPIYYDNDVEVFIAGRDAYYEFEINGFNTTYEAFFIWDDAYERDGFSRAPEFQRSLLQPFNGVGFTNHPRGGRLGDFNWHFPGKQTAVFIDGTMNDDKDRDRGWTVELAFPWKGMKWLAEADHRSLPPRDGDVWRLDFSRFNTYKEAPPANDSGGWVWSRHGVWDSHVPECFPFIRFSTNDVSQGAAP